MSFTMRRFCRPTREFMNYVASNSKRWNSTTASKEPGGFSKTILAGAGFGVLIGSGYAYYTLKYNTPDSQKVSVNEALLQKPITSVTSLPNVEFARQIKIPTDSSGLEVVLFQYPTCPFCCKVRAFLDFYGISYNVVEVNPVLRQQIKWSNYKKVPILLVGNGKDYVQMNDSSLIVSGLTTFLKNKDVDLVNILEYYPSVTDTKNQNANVINKYFVMHGGLSKSDLQKDKEERDWRKWADEVLVHTLSPNVYRTKEEALQAFNWFSEVGEWDRLFSSWERSLVVYVGAYAMYYIGKRLKKRHNLKDNVRESLYDECRIWVKEVEKRGRFFGGKSPNLADLAVYGVLSSIEGCQAFKELLDNTKISTWFYEMKKAAQNHAGMNTLR